jgi:hypothetical protein
MWEVRHCEKRSDEAIWCFIGYTFFVIPNFEWLPSVLAVRSTMV